MRRRGDYVAQAVDQVKLPQPEGPDRKSPGVSDGENPLPGSDGPGSVPMSPPTPPGECRRSTPLSESAAGRRGNPLLSPGGDRDHASLATGNGTTQAPWGDATTNDGSSVPLDDVRFKLAPPTQAAGGSSVTTGSNAPSGVPAEVDGTNDGRNGAENVVTAEAGHVRQFKLALDIADILGDQNEERTVALEREVEETRQERAHLLRDLEQVQQDRDALMAAARECVDSARPGGAVTDNVSPGCVVELARRLRAQREEAKEAEARMQAQLEALQAELEAERARSAALQARLQPSDIGPEGCESVSYTCGVSVHTGDVDADIRNELGGVPPWAQDVREDNRPSTPALTNN
eukprot:Hpha_TRINITY_DN16279_c5_g4::TRINITY_DN16279_c5_g4_i1::g.11879::m.11879